MLTLYSKSLFLEGAEGEIYMTPITQRKLETFVSGKFHWKGLTPTDQKAMAVELLKARLLLKQLNNYVGQLKDGQCTKTHTSE